MAIRSLESRFREIGGGGGRTLGACLPTEGGGGRGEGRKEEERWKESPVTCTASRDVRSVGRVLDGACPRLLISSSSVARPLPRFSRDSIPVF